MLDNVKKYLPQIFSWDYKFNILANKMQTHINNLKTLILGMKSFPRPDECPSNVIPELSFLLSAGVVQNDSDLTARTKVVNAVKAQQSRGTFTYDVKLVIDAITGYNSQIWRSSSGAADSLDWIMLSGNEASSILASHRGSMASGNSDSSFGLKLIGTGLEPEVAGNIFINCHYGVNTAVLTTPIVNQLIAALRNDELPCYFIVNLGYVNSSNQFIIYTTIS